MPANPLRKAISSGIKMNNKIGDLFADLGTSAHPRGAVMSIYRTSRLALKSALKEQNSLAAVSDVLRNMRRDLQREVSSVFQDSISSGVEEAQRQLRFYDIVQRGSIRLTDEENSAMSAVMTRFDSQAAAIRALVLTDADETQIIGDGEDRTGIFSAGDFISAAAYWTTFLVWNAFDNAVFSTPAEYTFQKQAIAALDNRTTDCCLRVHGQVQPFNKPFKLTGTPRFADEMDYPAFHYYCRTSVSLYVAEFDDGLTKQLRDGAKFFLSERAAGRNPDNDPANAFAS